MNSSENSTYRLRSIGHRGPCRAYAPFSGCCASSGKTLGVLPLDISQSRNFPPSKKATECGNISAPPLRGSQIIVSLNHDLGLRSSSFLLCKRPSAERTFGKAQASLAFHSLNHDLGLCPSSFLLCKRPSAERTFGKAQASLAFHSLNHDLLAVHDEQALRGLHHAATLQVVYWCGSKFFTLHS